MPEVIRCVLLSMLEAAEGRLCLLEVMRRVLEAVDDVLCLLEVTRRVLEAVEGESCFVVSKFPLWQLSR